MLSIVLITPITPLICISVTLCLCGKIVLVSLNRYLRLDTGENRGAEYTSVGQRRFPLRARPARLQSRVFRPALFQRRVRHPYPGPPVPHRSMFGAQVLAGHDPPVIICHRDTETQRDGVRRMENVTVNINPNALCLCDSVAKRSRSIVNGR